MSILYINVVVVVVVNIDVDIVTVDVISVLVAVVDIFVSFFFPVTNKSHKPISKARTS